MNARSVYTRFRAYQLGSAGDSFSLIAGDHFTLIEARLTDQSRPNVIAELQAVDKKTIDTLHITSWDQDHCALGDLKEILQNFAPQRIEYPGYPPYTENANACLNLINKYKASPPATNKAITCIKIDPEYISGLKIAENLAYEDIIYHPKVITEQSSNDNSTVKLYRKGSFNVASLGDVENITFLEYQKTLCRETDILLLAHHGSECATNSRSFLEKVKPKIAICGSNYDNKFYHPREKVRNTLSKLNIPLMTTKTGDVIIESIGEHNGRFRAWNLQANSTEIKSITDCYSKKLKILTNNSDTIRNIYRKKKVRF